jgi:hypothetical protein
MAGFMTEFRYRVHILTPSQIWTLPWLIILRLRLRGGSASGDTMESTVGCD